LYKDTKIAGEILSEVNASGGNLYYGHVTITEPKSQPNISSANSPVPYKASDTEEKSYVTLNVNGSNLVAADTLVASYCATQLYKRLDPETIKQNNGFKIIFNGDDYLFTDYKHYYKKTDVEKALKVFKQIEKYVDYTQDGDTCNALALIDKTKHARDFAKTTSQLKGIIFHNVKRTFHFYECQNSIIKGEMTQVPCFDVVTSIMKFDSSYVTIETQNLISEQGSTIIGINIHGID